MFPHLPLHHDDAARSNHLTHNALDTLLSLPDAPTGTTFWGWASYLLDEQMRSTSCHLHDDVLRLEAQIETRPPPCFISDRYQHRITPTASGCFAVRRSPPRMINRWNMKTDMRGGMLPPPSSFTFEQMMMIMLMARSWLHRLTFFSLLRFFLIIIKTRGRIPIGAEKVHRDN